VAKLKIIKEYYVCANKEKNKFMDKYFTLNSDVQEALTFSTKDHCKEWIEGNDIETAKPLKVKAAFVYR
jgi:hypothetical protein